jgi:hypothetical protein
MRLRELALRKVNGASDWQIAATLYTDFLLVIVVSLIAGFMLMALSLSTFKEYASIENSNINIYRELLIYAGLLIGFSVIVGGIPVLYFRKKTLHDNIKGGSKNIFRKVSLLIQLIISLGMIFCATVFIKQIHFLHHTDLGINRRNVAAVQAYCCPLKSPYYVDRIKQIPGIKDALQVLRNDFLKNMAPGATILNFEKDGNEKTYFIFSIQTVAHFFDFFGIEFIEGMPHPDEYIRDVGVFNETVMSEVGEILREQEKVVGVVRDFYLTPTTKAVPTMINFPFNADARLSAIAYRYEEGMRLYGRYLRGLFQIRASIVKTFIGDDPCLYPDCRFRSLFTYQPILRTTSQGNSHSQN